MKISFEEYCEDFLDLHIALMSAEQLADAKKGYAKLGFAKAPAKKISAKAQTMSLTENQRHES